MILNATPMGVAFYYLSQSATRIVIHNPFPRDGVPGNFYFCYVNSGNLFSISAFFTTNDTGSVSIMSLYSHEFVIGGVVYSL